jgi:hypothetical protein
VFGIKVSKKCLTQTIVRFKQSTDVKNAEFDADFKAVEKVAKKL